MAMIQRFEELLCWQKARQLTNAVYDLTDCPAFARDFQHYRTTALPHYRATASPAPCPRVKASSNTAYPDQSLCANASCGASGQIKASEYSDFDSFLRLPYKR